jgi:hypothetical protein
MYKSLSTLTNPFFCKNSAKSAEKLRFYAKKHAPPAKIWQRSLFL